VLPQVPEPARSPGVARAAAGPAALVPAAGGAAIGLAAGSTALAVVLGVAAWVTGATFTLRRSRRRGRRPPPATIDPWAVPEPWRQYVRQAQSAGQRFDQGLEQWREGPLRERLLTLRPLVAAAVEEVWSVARRGAALSGAPAAAGRASARRQLGTELQQVEAERLGLDPAAAEQAEMLATREAAIAAQIRAARKAEDAAGEAADRLRLMTAQLDEAITRMLTLELGPGGEVDPGAVDAYAPALEGLVQQIQALQDGLQSVEAPSPGSTSAGQPGPAAAPAPFPPAVPPSVPPAS
jgi:hypothetical protein